MIYRKNICFIAGVLLLETFLVGRGSGFENGSDLVTDVNRIREIFSDILSSPRSRVAERGRTRSHVAQLFKSYNLDVQYHTFTVSLSNFRGSNLVGILPGKHYGTKADEVIVIGAHYDTVDKAPGVVDNGSGTVAVIESARILGSFVGRNNLNYTVMFVLFDLEEKADLGSREFVINYLLPKLESTGAGFFGAFILDCILLFSEEPNTQVLSEKFEEEFPTIIKEIKENRWRGNFHSIWSRRGVDDRVAHALIDGFNSVEKSSRYRIYNFDFPLPVTRAEIKDETFGTSYLNSDHGSFWFLNTPFDLNTTYSLPTLPAILLTDWYDSRANYYQCYHKPCDNYDNYINNGNLGFLKQAIDAVVAAVINVNNTY